MPGIVSDVSAMLVATTQSLVPGGGGLNTCNKRMVVWNVLPIREKRQAVSSCGLQEITMHMALQVKPKSKTTDLLFASSSGALHPAQLIPQRGIYKWAHGHMCSKWSRHQWPVVFRHTVVTSEAQKGFKAQKFPRNPGSGCTPWLWLTLTCYQTVAFHLFQLN